MSPRGGRLADPTRVLHVVFSLDAGGLENGIINVANQLDGRYEIYVACLEQSGRMAPRFTRADRLQVLNRARGFSIGTVLRLARCIRTTRPHVLHTHNLGPLIYGALSSMMRPGVPILHGEHGQFTAADLLPRRLRQRRWLYRAARMIHTVSQGQAQELAALGLGRGKVRAIINGVDTKRFCPISRPELRQSLGIPTTDLVLGMVGRFAPGKRHEPFIEAFEQLRNGGLPVHLILMGAGGACEERVRERCRSSRAAACIHLLGFSQEPERLYPGLDLLVLPSTHEGLSNVALESMSCGTPVISHCACGSSELIESGVDGIVADLGSVELLSRALGSLARDRARLQHLGERARAKVVEAFSLERMSNEYATVYDGLRTR